MNQSRVIGCQNSIALKSPVMDYVEMRETMIGEEGMRSWEKAGITTLPDGTQSKFEFIKAARAVNEFVAISKIVPPILVVQGGADE